MPRKAGAMKKNKATVFVVHKSETVHGKHTVHYAKDGDLNRGSHRKFTVWTDAYSFGRKKAKAMNAEFIVSKH